MGQGVCVRLEVLSVCGRRGWLVGWVCLSLLMPSSHKPLTGSVHATSVAASRVEQALSEVASSLQSSTPKQGPLHPWMTLAQIWLHAGTALPLLGPSAPPPPLTGGCRILWAPASLAHGPSSGEIKAFAIAHQAVTAEAPCYPRGLCSETPSRCLEPQIVLNPLYTV